MARNVRALVSPLMLLLVCAGICLGQARASAPAAYPQAPAKAPQASVPGSVLAPLGKEFSVSLRLRAGALEHTATLLRLTDVAARPAVVLAVVPQSESPLVAPNGNQSRNRAAAPSENLIRFEVTTDFSPKPLVLELPTRLLDAQQAHRIILRDLGFRMDFLVDGVLADQEWPLGNVAPAGSRVAESARAIDSLRVEEGVLSDATVEQQAGGAAAIAARERSMFGVESEEMQYWRPGGYNTNAGDPMPFFHDGVLHVFFLLDRHHHQSKWGLGAHQWGHVSSTDLVHWKTYPPALTIEHEWEASICTGSVFFQDGKYYAFYATRIQDRSEHLAMAVSDDGISFHKLLPSPFADPKPPYRYGPNRDPFVFGSGDDFHMLVTASLASPPSPDQAGVLEHLTSPDLKTWTVAAAPFLVPGYKADPECSDLFLWRGWYYLIFSKDGQAHYRMSKNRSGPWIKPPVDVFDGIDARVMKTAAFTGDRRLGVAFTSDGGWYAGKLVFRELLQAPDGTLATTFPREMVPSGTPAPQLSMSIASGDATLSPQKMVLKAISAPASVSMTVPRNFLLRATFTPGPAAKAFGIRFAGRNFSAAESGIPTLEIDPAKRRIAWENSPSLVGPAPFIESVDGLDKAINIELVAKDTVVDLNVNGRHTLIHRLPVAEKPQILLFADAGELQVTDLAIEQLPDAASATDAQVR